MTKAKFLLSGLYISLDVWLVEDALLEFAQRGSHGTPLQLGAVRQGVHDVSQNDVGHGQL